MKYNIFKYACIEELIIEEPNIKKLLAITCKLYMCSSPIVQILIPSSIIFKMTRGLLYYFCTNSTFRQKNYIFFYAKIYLLYALRKIKTNKLDI